MITISGTLSKGWMNRALGVVFDGDYYFDPAKRRAIDLQCNEYAATEFPDMGLFYSESNLGQLDYWDTSQIQVGGIQPNMILGMLLGAEFVPCDVRDADVTADCLAETDPAELPIPQKLLQHNLITFFDQQIAEIRSTPEKQLRAIPPFFWDASGRATIHGVLTSAQKLWGQTIFLDMVSQPEKCMQMMQWIADAYIELCRHFALAADLQITGVHIGECSCCMISPALIERFVVPATSHISQALGPVRFHSCGASTHLLETFASITNLHSLDLGGETSLASARRIFGKDMPISIAPLPAEMSDESTKPILQWAKRTIEENAGGNIEFVYHLEPGYNVETILALTDYIKQQSDFKDLRLNRSQNGT